MSFVIKNSIARFCGAFGGLSNVAGSSPTPPNPFYPQVPSYSFITPAGSLGFPEGNGLSAGVTLYTSYTGALLQPRTNLTIPASTSPSTVLAIVRLPVDKRQLNTTFGIFGNASTTGGNRFRLRFNGGASGISSARDKFEVYNFATTGSAVTIQSPACMEDAALVAYKIDGANNHELAWYSLLTGTKNGTAPVVVSSGANAIAINSVNIGSNTGIATFPSPPAHSGWAGEIETVCIATVAISDANLQAIALGADIVSTVGAANIKYLRELDGSPSSLNAIAGTADTNAVASIISGSRLINGSTFRRQSTATWLLPNGLSHGWVYGLTAGQTQRLVPFAGTAGGLNGQTVEVRVVEETTGTVVRDWTTVGTVTSGSWSGNVELPRSNGTWWVAQFRCNGVLAFRHDLFAVGYKIVVLGQSQTSIGFGAVTAVTNNFPMTGSFATLDSPVSPSGFTVPQMGRIGMYFNEGGKATFLNAMRYFTSAPIMIIEEAVNGTGQDQFINDGESSRVYANFEIMLNKYGNDISAVVSNWGTNIMSSGSANIKNLMSAMVLGTGTLATTQNLTSDLQAGFKFVVSPLSRHTGNASDLSSAYTNQASNCRLAQVEWANDNNIDVGLPVSDMLIEDAGGPHQRANTVAGIALFAQRLAIGCAKALGLTNIQNPYFTTASLQAGNTQIVVNVALPNGGSLFSPAPSAIRSFAVNEGGGWTLTGFTAAIVGNTVVLTKSSGTFASGTQVQYLSNLADRLNGATAEEDAIINGSLYETWAGDTLQNKGLPVLGSLSSGRWVPTWQVSL